MDTENNSFESNLAPELYFLITKFLAGGPLKETAKVLIKELEQQKVLPKRLDWLGNKHEQTFTELEHQFGHIGPNHLLEICQRIGPILDKDLPPSAPGVLSLLGSGRQSLLRTHATVYHSRTLLDYCTRIHSVSLPDSSITKPTHNIQNVLFGREYGGPVHRKLLVPTTLYSKTTLLRRTVGHLSSVYCVLFDRTGRYIATGADDLLVKIWSSYDGRLLTTLRGASSEITDIAINLDNTMLAAGSIDRILRVWDLQTASPLAVLSGHTGMITSVNFCPSPRTDLKYLVTTSTDGSIAFWQYTTPRGQKVLFAPKPTQYHEKLRPGQAQMLCATFSPGGMFLAAGSADHHVRVYLMADDGPKRILELEAYADAVDSVQWAHRGLRFISGSKDGTAHIWTFESQQWKNVKLSMSERTASCPEPEEGKKLKVTMVAWDCSDDYVITAANDFTIKIWNSKTAKLHCVLRGHTDELYVLESNPKDKHVLLSAGHDGKVFLWDIERGVSVANFINDIDGQGHGGVFDAKWSPDGTMIAATDSHGHLLIFGLGYGPEKYQQLPTELFFHTDYRPLVRDASHHVVDEQTQVMPHLMPPPFLVDAYGSPHPAKYQRFVPGRESCSTDQLIPNVALEHDAAVVDEGPQLNGVGAAGNFLHIDRLIAALANRSGVGVADAANASAQNDERQNGVEQNRLSGGGAAGNVLGRNPMQVNARRQSEANSVSSRQGSTWGRPSSEQPQLQQQPAPSPMKYIRRVFVRPMKYSHLQNLKQSVYSAGVFEMQEYKREMRRRPIMISTASLSSASAGQTSNRSRSGRIGNAQNGSVRTGGRPGRRRNQDQSQAQSQSQSQSQPRPPPAAYRTRAARDAEPSVDRAEADEEDEEESSASSGDTSYSNAEEQLDDSSDDSDTESSDYSDWVADTPGPNLEPPQRSKRKPLDRAPTAAQSTRRIASDDSSDEDGQEATTSAAAAAKAARRRREKRNVIPPRLPRGTEIPELYRPPEWLSEVIPRKAPYYPQMGDEVVYFRQGHQRYLDAVSQKKIYKLAHSSEPWNFRTLRDHEVVRIIGIKYEIRPPRLCCLKLAIIDEDGNMTGSNFKIKYHDMPDVLDFLVLKQSFDLAVQRNWSVGDRFRCMIGDMWWTGQIESRYELTPEFPDSYFMCFRVRWDNGEYEYMSPWDMEPIDENRLPNVVGGAMPVLPEEIRTTLYQPKSEEWHRGDRDGSCRRIINGLEQLMNLSIAEPFLAPVDLTEYPDYAYAIEYPIDLSLIKARFENHFYRRITSAQFDVRYLATNAEKYNKRHSAIVRHARITTDLCLRIIRDQNDIDVAAVYHQLVDVYHSTENDDSDSVVQSTTSTGPTSSAARQNVSSTRRLNRARSDVDWRVECRQLLDMMCQRPDSEPFREPVDTIEFPDYLEIIATPMDLRTVREDLLGGNYEDPLDFAKDVRLIFQNSKNYNTNKRSRIYAMTLRLSALFESQIKTVITNWKAACRRANKAKIERRSGGSGATSSSPNKTRSSASKKNTRGNHQRNARRVHSSPEEHDDEEEDDDDEDDRPGPSQRRNGSTRSGAIVASTSGSNRVTSSSQHVGSTRRRRRHGHATVGNSDNRRSSRRKAASQELSQNDDDDDDDDEENQLPDDEELNATENSHNATSTDDEEATSDSDDDDDDDDASATSSDNDDDDDNDGRHRRKGRRGGRKKRNSSADVDSEESYKPENERGGRGSSRRGAGRKGTAKHDQKSGRASGRKAKRSNQNSTRKRRHDDDDDDADDNSDTMPRKIARKRIEPSNEGRNSTVKRNGDIKNTLNARSRRRRPVITSDEDHDNNSNNTANNNNTSSHVDESTQDSVINTPRKRGRQAVVSAPPDGPSVSSHAASTTAGTGRSTRYQQQNAASSSRRHPAENDHSYHLPVRNGGRIAESDTDSREMAAARPTRASVKRAFLSWARSSDVEDASEEAEEILPTPTPTKAHNGASTSRAAAALSGNNSGSAEQSNAPVRQLRTNRNTVVEPPDDTEDDDDDDDSDNEPLATSQGSLAKQQQRPQSNFVNSRQTTAATTASAVAHQPRGTAATTTNLPHPTHLLRTRAHLPQSSHSITHMTRSQATSTTSNVATTSTANITTAQLPTVAAAAPPHTNHDHNYLGAAAGASTAAAAASQRSLRRVLSRHQRNADELDSTVDFLEQPVLPRFFRRGAAAAAASTIPQPSTTTTAAIPSSSTASTAAATTYSSEPRRGRSSRSQQDQANTSQAETNESTGASDVGTDGGSRRGGSRGLTDSDENQPLTSFVPANRRLNERATAAAAATTAAAAPNATRRTRRQNLRNASDDSSIVNEDDDDDYEATLTRHHKQQKSPKRQRRRRRFEDESSVDGDDGGSRSRRKRMLRESRNQKRPRYNEQSDDEANTTAPAGVADSNVAADHGESNRRFRKRTDDTPSNEEGEETAQQQQQHSRQRQRQRGNSNSNIVTAPSAAADDVDDDDDGDESSDEQLVSVSSRGRVRKITAKARKYLKE